MQVFLPYPDFAESVACLDPKRLGNQIYRECVTLVRGKWPNHPVSKIWLPHKRALAEYSIYGLLELKNRGRNYPHWFSYFFDIYTNEPDTGLPDLIGYEPFHASHRAALLAKNPTWYSQFGWTETPQLGAYVWQK